MLPNADNFKSDPKKILEGIFALRSPDGRPFIEDMDGIVSVFQYVGSDLKDFEHWGVKSERERWDLEGKGVAFVALLRVLQEHPEKINELDPKQRLTLTNSIILIAKTLKAHQAYVAESYEDNVALGKSIVEAIDSIPIPPDLISPEELAARYWPVSDNLSAEKRADIPKELPAEIEMGQRPSPCLERLFAKQSSKDEQSVAFWRDAGQRMLELCASLDIPVSSNAAKYIKRNI